MVSDLVICSILYLFWLGFFLLIYLITRAFTNIVIVLVNLSNVLSQLSHFWDTVPCTRNLKEKSFNLAQSFEEFSPWSLGCKAGASWWKDMVEQSCSVHGGHPEAEQGNNVREERARDCTQYPIHTSMTHPDTPRSVLSSLLDLSQFN